MNVIGGHVDWKPGYDQRPQLHAVIEGEIPRREEFEYQSDRERSFWWGAKDGFYSYFAGHPDEPGDGFGGETYTLDTPNGEVTLEGPYSSRAGVVNALGHGPCVDLRVHEGGDADRTARAASVALEHAREAAEHAGVTLFRNDDLRSDVEGEYRYMVRELHPPEWTWDGEESDRLTQDETGQTGPYGEGAFTHPDGTRITIDAYEWEEDRMMGGEATAYHAVLEDETGAAVEDVFTRRPDVGYHYLMAVHGDRDPDRKAAEAPEQSEKQRRWAEEAGVSVPAL